MKGASVGALLGCCPATPRRLHCWRLQTRPAMQNAGSPWQHDHPSTDALLVRSVWECISNILKSYQISAHFSPMIPGPWARGPRRLQSALRPEGPSQPPSLRRAQPGPGSLRYYCASPTAHGVRCNSFLIELAAARLGKQRAPARRGHAHRLHGHSNAPQQQLGQDLRMRVIRIHAKYSFATSKSIV